MNNNEQLMELYSLGFAPLGHDTLLGEIQDLEGDDMNPDLVTEELNYISGMQTFGFAKFVRYLEQYRDAEPQTAPQEVGAAVQCLRAYLKRMKGLNAALLKLVDTVAVQYGDPTPSLKAYESEVKQNRRPAAVADFAKYFDMTPNCRWSVAEDVSAGGGDAVGGGRVEFKKTTRVLTGENEEAEGELKVSEISRKKQRNPTGYQKFTFRDLGLTDSDIRFGDDQSLPASTSASSFAGRDSDGGDSSARGSSVAEECRRQEALNPFNKGSGGRSDSFVMFSSEDIQDTEGDPQWATETRHQKRFSRIRNRVPTGHPSMVKKKANDLNKLILELEINSDLEMDNDDNLLLATKNLPADCETVKNTMINRRTSTAISPPQD